MSIFCATIGVSAHEKNWPVAEVVTEPNCHPEVCTAAHYCTGGVATMATSFEPLQIENAPAGPVELPVRVPGFRVLTVCDVQLTKNKNTEVKVTPIILEDKAE